MANLRKISVSLPEELVVNLDYLASRTGTSRSAIISEFLSEAAEQTRKLLELVPPNPTAADVVRMRGESEAVVRERLASLQGIANDLFSK
jgi:metal-responsive CopG/Arc/MetJ family transcriptional regulator